MLEPEAFHGLAGDIVRAVEPHSEAIRRRAAADLGGFRRAGRAWSACAGRGDQHHANVNVLLVGKTSKGRKGTSWGRVRGIFSDVEGWPPTRVRFKHR